MHALDLGKHGEHAWISKNIRVNCERMMNVVENCECGELAGRHYRILNVEGRERIVEGIQWSNASVS